MLDMMNSYSNRSQFIPAIKQSANIRSDFSMPYCEDNSDEASFEPNISSDQKLDQSVFEMANIKRETKIPLDQESNQDQLIKKSNKKWGLSGLSIIFFLTKFVKQMKNHSTQVKFKSLNADILMLISDSASDSDVLLQKNLNKISTLIYGLKGSVNHLPIIDPDSNFKVMWDIFLLIQIILSIFYIPMKLGFGFNNDKTMQQLFFESLPSWTFIVDIIINFFTAYYSKGQIHKSHKDIFRNYARSKFWWDLLFVIPFILSFFNIPYTEYILMLRMAKVKNLIDQLEEAINPSITMQTVMELFKSVFLLLFVSHCCACLWNFIGQIQLDAGKYSWLDSKGIIDASWESRYIHSLYFSTITTLTVGYGDIVPQTDLERTFVILMAMVICGLFGYTISSIGNILRQLTEKEYIYKQKMMQLNNYVKKRQLSKQLILQVRKYFEHYLKMQDENNEFGENMMKTLNKRLKEQVAIDLYKNILMSSRLIKKTLSEKSVQKLCSFVREKRFAPEEIVETQNELANKLYFIQKGQINLICDQAKRETKLAVIDAGKFIGEKEFIMQTQYDYSIRTTKFCQIVYIEYEDFLNITKEDSIEEQNYQMLKDEMQFYEEKQNYGEVCYICRWTHQFKKCPFVFYIANLGKLRKQFMINESNKRSKFNRVITEKIRFNLQLIQQAAIQQIVDNNIICLEDLTDQYLNSLGYIRQYDHVIETLLSEKSNTLKSIKYESENEENQAGLKNLPKCSTIDQKIQLIQMSSDYSDHGEASEWASKFLSMRANRRTLAQLQQIQTLRGSSVSLLSQDLSNQGQSSQQNSSSSSSFTGQIQPQQLIQPSQEVHLNGLANIIRKGNSSTFQNLDQKLPQLLQSSQKKSHSELRQISIPVIQEYNIKLDDMTYNPRLRIDFELDKCKNTLNYFPQYNLDTVLMKVKKPKKTSRHATHLLTVIENRNLDNSYRDIEIIFYITDLLIQFNLRYLIYYEYQQYILILISFQLRIYQII